MLLLFTDGLPDSSDKAEAALRDAERLGCEVYGVVESSVLSNNAVVEPGAEVEYSILMPGARVCAGAKVAYAIIGENTVICRGATVGAPPGGSLDWGVATCGPNIRIGEGMTVPAHAMVYETPEVEM